MQFLASINHFEILASDIEANSRQTREAPFHMHFKASFTNVDYFPCPNWLFVFIPFLLILFPLPHNSLLSGWCCVLGVFFWKGPLFYFFFFTYKTQVYG